MNEARTNAVSLEQQVGPLAGNKVVEMGGIGPAPFAGMMLADLGAEVVRFARPATTQLLRPPPEADFLSRNKFSLTVDAKSEAGHKLIHAAISAADVLIEGYRPGVMESLGLGPEVFAEANPGLVYGRATGWGQTGPLAGKAGHDINYIALNGILDAIGHRGDRPVPPLNLVADYGGGGMLLTVGILAALFERASSGKGQTVDAAMVEGASLLFAAVRGLAAAGLWRPNRGTNILDSGAHFYDTYETADAKFIAVGCLEQTFYVEFLARLDIDSGELGNRKDPSTWDGAREKVAAVIATRTQDEWVQHFEGSDACVTPVLDMTSAAQHPHPIARRSFVEVGGQPQPAPAPRLSNHPEADVHPCSSDGNAIRELLGTWGLADHVIQEGIPTE